MKKISKYRRHRLIWNAIHRWKIMSAKDFPCMHGLDLEDELFQALIDNVQRNRND